jgi:hypothetical protein
MTCSSSIKEINFIDPKHLGHSNGLIRRGGLIFCINRAQFKNPAAGRAVSYARIGHKIQSLRKKSMLTIKPAFVIRMINDSI